MTFSAQYAAPESLLNFFASDRSNSFDGFNGAYGGMRRPASPRAWPFIQNLRAFIVFIVLASVFDVIIDRTTATTFAAEDIDEDDDLTNANDSVNATTSRESEREGEDHRVRVFIILLFFYSFSTRSVLVSNQCFLCRFPCFPHNKRENGFQRFQQRRALKDERALSFDHTLCVIEPVSGSK